jgi:anti-sigma regulatory factor (Ser/Thr protein kinase)
MEQKQRTEIVESRPIVGRESVGEVRRTVRDRLAGLRVDPDVAHDCLVAVTEACTNALTHGKRNESATIPTISWRIDGSQAQFSIEDFSHRGWSVAERSPAAESEVSPIAGHVGGFGLHLMADLMDEVTVSIGAAGTRVTMTKRFAAP